MSDCVEAKKLNLMVKEIDAVFLKIDSAIVQQKKLSSNVLGTPFLGKGSDERCVDLNSSPHLESFSRTSPLSLRNPEKRKAQQGQRRSLQELLRWIVHEEHNK